MLSRTVAVGVKMEESKLILDRLDLEVTRRCNMRCKHCFAGEPQNVDIDEKTIDIVLNQVKEIGALYIRGGEPMLNAERIVYLVDQIIERQIPLHYLGIVTNGTIGVLMDKNMMTCDALNKIADHIAEVRKQGTFPETDKFGNEKCVALTISNDRWHKECNSEIYMPKETALMYMLKRNDHVYVNYNDESHAEDNLLGAIANKYYLNYSGRAKDNIWDVPYLHCNFPFHRISVKEETAEVMCGLYIAANGNICVAGQDVSFVDFDKIAAGNIADMTIRQAIEKWNRMYPASCLEAKQIEYHASMAINRAPLDRKKTDVKKAKLMVQYAFDSITMRSKIYAFCPLDDNELQVIVDSAREGRPEQYGEELIVLHNDAVERGITVEPMRRIDVAQKNTIVTAILNNKV